MTTSQLPVALADLTPDRLKGVSQVRVLDPRTGSPGITLTIPGRAWLTPGEDRTLTVLIDQDRVLLDVAALRGIIALATGPRG